MASEIYAEHMTKLFFPNLVTYMSSGPVLVMQLAREKAVAYLKDLVGPSNPVRARITHPNWLVLQHIFGNFVVWGEVDIFGVWRRGVTACVT